MRRYIIIMFALTTCAAPGSAQLNIDSLKNLIRQGDKEDTALVERLLQVSDFYIYDKPDSGIDYANKALQHSQQQEYKDGEVWAYVNLGQGYFVLGDYAQSLHFSLRASNLYQQMKRPAGVSSMKYYLGSIYREMGNHKLALRNYFDARKMDEENPDDFRLMYPNLSMELRMMLSDVRIAEAYLAGNSLDSALFFAKRGFAKDRELRNDWTLPALVLGNVYSKRSQFDSALYCYRSSFKHSARNDFIEINNGISTVYRYLNQIDSCRYYAEMALDTAQTINYRKGAMRASELLSWVYEKTNPIDAIRYFKTSIAIKDSLYNQEKISRVNGLVFEEKQREQVFQAALTKYQNRLKIYGLLVVVGFFLLIALFLWRSNRHREKAYVLLQKQQHETDHQKLKAENALEELKATQGQLLQREKMASLGELTAGIAHEIQNPLNFINNFSEVNKELLEEMNEKIEKENFNEIKTIANSIIANEEKVIHHGKRADGIVKGMLQHSRSSSAAKELADINALAGEYLRLAYHGLRAKDKSFNVTMKTDFDETIGSVKIVPQDIGRVILNLINNSFYAVMEKKKQINDDYEPTVTVSTRRSTFSDDGRNCAEISVQDNGTGIPQTILDKIFQPFFSTKPTGQGTGLGLSLSYDIVKAHGGLLNVETKEGAGAEFVILLPIE